MIVDIQTRRLRTIGQLRAFVEGNAAVDFQPRDRDEAYGFVRDTLERFGYRRLGKRDKGVVLRFLVAATGISLKQTERLVRQWRETGAVRNRRGGGRGRPPRPGRAPRAVPAHRRRHGRRPRRRITPSRGAGRRGGPLAARAGMAPAGDTMNLTEPAKCQARTDDSGRHPRPQRRVAARPSRVRFAGRDALRSLANPRPDSFQSSRQSPTVIAASRPPLTAAPLRLADTLASLAPRRTGRA